MKTHAIFWRLFYFLIGVIPRKLNGAPTIFGDLKKLQHFGKACTVERSTGFHVQRLLGALSTILNINDCLLTCMLRDDCFSVNYVKFDAIGRLCFLSGNKVKSYEELYSIDASTYAHFSCENGAKASVPVTKISHGFAPAECGQVAFNTRNFVTHPDLPRIPEAYKRIVRGSQAPPYSNPWLGIVLRDGNIECGISLIAYDLSDKYTLFGISSAHCFIDPHGMGLGTERFTFMFGVHDTRYPTPHIVHRKAEAIQVHKEYNVYNNDIAVVKFKSQVWFNNYVRPICLPEQLPTPNSHDIHIGSASRVCGLGAIEVTHTDRFPHVPHCLDVTLMLADYPSLRIGKVDPMGHYGNVLNDIQSTGTSEGDSGSPLSVLINNQYTILGVTKGIVLSHYSTTGAVNLYVRVPLYVDWIKDLMTILKEIDMQYD